MQNIHSVVLAAGLSRRMNSRRTNKVCLELLGKPVIVRVLEALKNSHINSHTVVTGASAEQVMKVLSVLLILSTNKMPQGVLRVLYRLFFFHSFNHMNNY